MDHEIDILDRDAFIDNLMQIVDTLSQQKQGTTFAIDGGWGYGKTFVLQKFMQRIEKEKKKSHIVLYYNCWKYDYYEEPLIAFTAALQDLIAEKTSIFSPKVKEMIASTFFSVIYCLGAVPSQLLEYAVGVNPQNIYKEAKADSKRKQTEQTAFDKYSNLKQAILKVQKLLHEIQNKHTLIILIDEIDRCLPPYQIKILERFHHLFQVDNIISIFSVNRSQLEESVKQLYGGGKERVNHYLKKFMSFSVSIDAGNPNERVNEKFSDCLALYDETFFAGGFELKAFLYSVSPDMDIRGREKLWEKLKLLHSLSFSRKVGYDILAYELLWLIMQEFKDCYFQHSKMTPSAPSDISYTDLMSPVCKGALSSLSDDNVLRIPLYLSDYFNELTTKHPSSMQNYFNGKAAYILTDGSSLYEFLLAYWSQRCKTKIGFVFGTDSFSRQATNKFTKEIYEQNLEDLKKFRELSQMLSL